MINELHPHVVIVNLNCIVLGHHFGSTLECITFNDNHFWILGCFIALPINVSLGSMNVIDGIMYLARCSSVLGIFDIIYCIFSRM